MLVYQDIHQYLTNHRTEGLSAPVEMFPIPCFQSGFEFDADICLLVEDHLYLGVVCFDEQQQGKQQLKQDKIV